MKLYHWYTTYFLGFIWFSNIEAYGSDWKNNYDRIFKHNSFPTMFNLYKKQNLCRMTLSLFFRNVRLWMPNLINAFLYIFEKNFFSLHLRCIHLYKIQFLEDEFLIFQEALINFYTLSKCCLVNTTYSIQHRSSKNICL